MTDVEIEAQEDAEEARIDALAALLHGAYWVAIGEWTWEKPGSFDEQYETIKDHYRTEARWLLANGVRLEVAG